MLDGLLKSKFYSKCKSAIKITKTRLEMIKRKRIAMQKYLKNDVVDLLKNGLDTNAYGRVEGLWNELNLSSCYDLVEQYSTIVSSHLANMDKQRECPEECREAASSLMFAAARFSDLPELRELRTIFTERFGNSIELYVNKEFVHKLKSTPPTKDMKLQLMQDIALESGIEWNSKTLEQKLYKSPAASVPDGKNGKINSPKRIHNANKKIDNEDVENKLEDPEIHAAYEREGGKDVRDERRSLIDPSSGETEDIIPVKDIQVDGIGRKVQPDEPQATSASVEENDEKQPFYYKPIRPPYSKSKISITDIAVDVPPTGADSKGQEGKESSKNSGGVGSETLGSKGINDRQRDERDEEGKVMDRLLMHYSTKKFPHDTAKSDAVLKSSSQPDDIKPGRGSLDRSRDGRPTRAASLPSETSPTEATKLRARASSFQPEVLNSSGHIHPKLPDYDDFVARLAALRANRN
ncbi:unnamed protein product [Coffea canephora]|uniref:IST1-like protein n=1 Tax=Coffea canephora TaxID=49390 RepID=A0A068TP67_COFCA|nr:unnamed protein product [Coffea canephora]